jgi:hypothetical protein
MTMLDEYWASRERLLLVIIAAILPLQNHRDMRVDVGVLAILFAPLAADAVTPTGEVTG